MFALSATFETKGIGKFLNPWDNKISTTFTDTEVNNCFSIYHASLITNQNAPLSCQD